MARLVTSVELDSRGRSVGVSVRARHELELSDGTRVVLLDDRGWSSSRSASRWTQDLVREIQDTARMVVGPDEPFGDWTYERMAEGHWQTLATIAQSRGITISAHQLCQLPHDVEFGPELTALLRSNG